MSKITKIEEVTGEGEKYYGYDGYRVTCDDGKIVELLISNGQNCCEVWGYATTNDNLDDFIGATLLEVKVTDTGLKTETLPDYIDFEKEACFLTLETSKGTLQFTVYNHHNGYYCHTVRIRIGGVTEERDL